VRGGVEGRGAPGRRRPAAATACARARAASRGFSRRAAARPPHNPYPLYPRPCPPRTAAPAATDSWEQEQLTRPFLKAAEEGDAPAVARLLGAGADVNAREEPQLSERYSTGWTSGRTALIKAAQQARAAGRGGEGGAWVGR
jgi:hypothetical protein